MDNDLSQQLAELSQRVAALESEVTRLRQLAPEIDEETLMAISAAVSAYLGVKAKVKQVHFRSRGSWVTEGREAVHRRSVPHVR